MTRVSDAAADLVDRLLGLRPAILTLSSPVQHRERSVTFNPCRAAQMCWWDAANRGSCSARMRRVRNIWHTFSPSSSMGSLQKRCNKAAVRLMLPRRQRARHGRVRRH